MEPGRRRGRRRGRPRVQWGTRRVRRRIGAQADHERSGALRSRGEVRVRALPADPVAPTEGSGRGRDLKVARVPLGIVGVLHIGERRPRGPIPGFPHDSKVIPKMSIFSARAPMCRGTRSAHGSPSTKNRHSSKKPGIARKTHNRPAPLRLFQCAIPPHGLRRTSHHPGAALRRRPPRPIRTRSAPIGSAAPADREKRRSERIVPPRTR